MRMVLPDAVVSAAGRQEVVWTGREIAFSNAVAEPSIDCLRPDVVVQWEGGDLWVEIFVSNAVKPRKQAIIRDQKRAVVEVDLSRFPRDASPEEVRQAVLGGALTHWLHHPASTEVEARILRQAEEAAAREDARRADQEASDRRRAERLQRALAEPWVRGWETDAERKVRNAQLASLLDPQQAGAGSFSVPPAAWQSALLERLFLKERRKALTRQELFEVIRPFVRRDAEIRDEEARKRIRAAVPDYVPPWEAMVTFLKGLNSRNHVRLRGYEVLPDISIQERLAIGRKRWVELRETFGKLEAALVGRLTLKFRDWVRLPVCSGCTPEALMLDDVAPWIDLHRRLQAVLNLVTSSGPSLALAADLDADDPPVMTEADLLGFPLGQELATWNAAIASAKRQRDQALLVRWQAEVVSLLGPERGRRWAEENIRLSAEGSRASERDSVSWRLESLRREVADKAKMRASLLAEATRMLRSEEWAEEWCAATVDPALEARRADHLARTELARALQQHARDRLAAIKAELSAKALALLGEEEGLEWITRGLIPALSSGLPDPGGLALLHRSLEATVASTRG